MKTVAGVFERQADLQGALDDLRAIGVANTDISVVAQDTKDAGTATATGNVAHTASGTEVVATSGAVLGGGIGLLAGLGAFGALLIPGIGPVIAAGTLATALAGAGIGAVAGAATGGLVGSLIDSGVSEEDAHMYAESVRRGGTLVTVSANDTQAEEVSRIFHRFNAIDMNQRRETLKNEGWSRFDGDAPNPGMKRDWEDSSKVGTGAGALAGATTGAVAGAVAGPIGAVVGGVTGAVVGAGSGGVADAAGEHAKDETLSADSDRTMEYRNNPDRLPPIVPMGVNSTIGNAIDNTVERVDEASYRTGERVDTTLDTMGRPMRDAGDHVNMSADAPNPGVKRDWEDSSKVGTGAGALAGAATGAAAGAVAGPIGAVVGGVAGAVVGAGSGGVADAAGEHLEDEAKAKTK